MPIGMIISLIFGIVQLVEKTMPDSKGKEKFDAATSAVAQVAGDLASQGINTGTIINGAVDLLNAAKVFNKQEFNTNGG